MEEKKKIVCPLCGCAEFSIKYVAQQQIVDPKLLYGAASGIKGTQTLVSCKSCELLYENPRYDEEIITTAYKDCDDVSHDSQHDMRVKSFYNALKKNEKYLPVKGSKVLDIGTAGGAFIVAGKQFGYNVIGMEPSSVLVAEGKSKGLDILQGTIELNEFLDNSFDMVCLWDVIEHLCDPNAAMKEVARLLKPGGIVLVNYPNIGTWAASVFGKNFWWLISVHLVHFSPKTMQLLLSRNGFEQISSKKYSQVLELGYLIDMAVHLGVPLSRLGRAVLPSFIKKLPIHYYASQTTAIAKLL